MEEWKLQPMDGVTIGLALIVLILLIRTFILGSKLKKLRKSYTQFMNGNGVEGLESIIIEMQERLRVQEQNHNELKNKVASIDAAVREKKGNVGIYRYNAFSERGSDLSFSLAFVNDKEDGLVLSGIHSRDETYVYAKPVKQGESDYSLSPEEKKAINLALQRE